MNWATITIFIMGIANFALNRAVFESGHPMLARLPQVSRTFGRRAALGSEFAVLFFALLYPGISGLPIPADWAAFLANLPGGKLMYGA